MKKKNLLKKAAAYVSVMLMVLSVFPITAAAADDTVKYIVNENFDGLEAGAVKGQGITAFSSNNKGTSGAVEVAKEENGTQYMRYEKNVTRTDIPCYTDVSVSNGSLTVGDDFVLEFKFKYWGTLYDCTLCQGRKEGAKFQNFLFIKNGNIVDSSDKKIIENPKADTWYTIALALHEKDRNYDVYVNGYNVSTATYTTASASYDLKYTCIRCLNITSMTSTCTAAMDDLKLYNAVKPIIQTEETDPETDPGTDTEIEAETLEAGIIWRVDESRYAKEVPEFTAKEQTIKTNTSAQLNFNETMNDKIYIAGISAGALLALAGCIIVKKKV